MDRTYSGEAGAVINRLMHIGIKFVAIDFDLTLVDLFTADMCAITDMRALCKCVRPFFTEFIPLAIQNNLMLAIVTFSQHVEMIASLLRHLFGNVVADRITIRGNDGSWDYLGVGSRDGKQSHMASAAEHLSKSHCVSLSRAQTVLIDDDVDNIIAALDNQVRAVQCDPKNPKKFVHDLITLT